MNTQYSSLDEAFPDKPWPKKGHSMTSSKNKEPPRDAEKEGRVFPTPIHRGQAAIQKHKKSIDDLTGSLPIAQDDEESNFAPAKIEPVKEHFSATKEKIERPFYPVDDGTSFAYAPLSFQRAGHELHMERIYQMLDQHGNETPATQDLLLYIFTGVFFLFTFDTFVNLGKNLR
jgi:hypothetical protein